MQPPPPPSNLPKTCINNVLPDELLLLVFSHLDTYSLCTGAEVVCVRWCHLAQDNSLYRPRLQCTWIHPHLATKLNLRDLWQAATKLISMARDSLDLRTQTSIYSEVAACIDCPCCCDGKGKLKVPWIHTHTDAFATCANCKQGIKFTQLGKERSVCPSILQSQNLSPNLSHRCATSLHDSTMTLCVRCFRASHCWCCGRVAQSRCVSDRAVCPTCLEQRYLVCSVCYHLVETEHANRCPFCPYSILCQTCPCPCNNSEEEKTGIPMEN